MPDTSSPDTVPEAVSIRLPTLSWEKVLAVVTALAMYEADGMILKIEGNKLPSDTRLVWLYGGPTNKRFSREGDMGVDAPDCFDLKPDYCVDNIYRLDDDGFDVVVWYLT